MGNKNPKKYQRARRGRKLRISATSLRWLIEMDRHVRECDIRGRLDKYLEPSVAWRRTCSTGGRLAKNSTTLSAAGCSLSFDMASMIPRNGGPIRSATATRDFAALGGASTLPNGWSARSGLIDCGARHDAAPALPHRQHDPFGRPLHEMRRGLWRVRLLDQRRRSIAGADYVALHRMRSHPKGAGRRDRPAGNRNRRMPVRPM
jgi:hypothetical protein